MKLLDPIVEFHGPTANHNMPCAVYRDRSAVFDCNTGIFHPSWLAQTDGWRLVRAKPWFQRLILRVAFQGNKP